MGDSRVGKIVMCDTDSIKSRISIISITISLFLLVVVGMVVKCSYLIEPGFAGVIYSINGDIEKYTFNQGWHVVLPWKSVIKYPVSTEVVYYTKNNDSNKDTSINVNSKDGKQVSVDITYAYHFNQELLPALYTKFRGRNYTEIESSIMKNEMFLAVNDITSKYNLIDLVGEKRSEVNQEIFDKFKTALSNYGIILETFNLSDVRPDEATKEAVQTVVNAQISLAKSRVELEQADVEANKARVSAKSIADSLVIQKQGEATANNLVGW